MSLRLNSNPTYSSGEHFDRAIEWLLISLVAFMPFAFGAVEPWSEQVVIALAAAISVLFVLKLVLQQDVTFVWSWAYVPVAIFIAAVVFQLLPLPTALVKAISPNTAAIRNELLKDLPNASEILSSTKLSFYPRATRHDLRLILSVATVFVVVINVFRRADQIKRLLGAIAVIAGALTLLALAQDLFGNGKIYWMIPTPRGKDYSGTFINHSHFGQFMNLSIGATLGLLLVKLREAFAGKKITPPVVAEYLSTPQGRIIWLLVLLIVLAAAAVFVSLTRGGMITMLIAATFTTLILSSRRSLQGRGWIMALMALGAFICVLYVGFDAVYDRLATLRDLHDAESGRWQIVKDISVAWTKFPILGTGLGTHEVVYPMFDRSTIPALASHAENEYAQTVEEAGIIGLSVLVIFGVIVWFNYVRNIASPSPPIRSAAYGLGFGLLAVTLHSLSDFGQHLPANFMLSAIFCALLTGLARMDCGKQTILRDSKKSVVRRPVVITALITLLVIWSWALLDANSARAADAHWKRALTVETSLRQENWQGTNEQFRELISHAALAADYQPDDVKYRHWLNVYRWYSISRTTDPNTGQILISEQMAQFVPRIINELHEARRLCPVFGATYCIVGQLEKYIMDDPNGVEHIQTGYRLAPCDPTACLVAGVLDATEGRIEQAAEKLEKAVKLDSRLFFEVVDVYINIDRPDLAVAVAADNANRLSYVADHLADIQGKEELANAAKAQVNALLKEKSEQPDAPAYVFASLAAICRNEDKQAAVEYYRRALALNYGQVHWRMNLARLLAETQQIPEAIHEARICLRLRPQFKAAEKLIAELSVHPDAGVTGTESP